jgi:acyl carrier protein
MDTDVESFLLASVATVCNVERSVLTSDTGVFEAGLDSLNLVAIIGQLEGEFGVQITPEQVLEAFSAVTLGDLVSFAQGLRRETA